MNEKMKNNSSKQILMSILGVVILIIAVVGISFAAFTYTGTGEKDNTITTGTISMTYTESTNGISIVNAQAMSDDQGKLLAGENEIFDFIVSSTLSGDTIINYDVVAVKQPVTNPLADNQVKLYLEKSADGKVYTQAMEPKNYTPGTGTSNGGPVGSMLLYTGSHTTSTTDYFRLRMWLDSEHAAEELGTPEKSFTVRVNVYAKTPPEVKVTVPSSETQLLGEKTAQDLQENVAVDAAGNVTGTLKYVENFTEFGGDDTTGNFLALYFEEAKSDTVTVEIKGEGAVLKKPVVVDSKDGLMVFKIANTSQTIEVKSAGKTTRVLNLSKLDLKQQDSP